MSSVQRPHRLEPTQRCRVFFTMLYSLPTTPGSTCCMMFTSRGCAPNRALYLLLFFFFDTHRPPLLSVCSQRQPRFVVLLAVLVSLVRSTAVMLRYAVLVAAPESDMTPSARAVCCSDLGKDASSSTSPGGAFGSIEGRIDTLTAELERSIKEVRAQPLFATTCNRTWPQETWPALSTIFGHPPPSSLFQPCVARRTQRSVQARLVLDCGFLLWITRHAQVPSISAASHAHVRVVQPRA